MNVKSKHIRLTFSASHQKEESVFALLALLPARSFASLQSKYEIG